MSHCMCWDRPRRDISNQRVAGDALNRVNKPMGTVTSQQYWIGKKSWVPNLTADPLVRTPQVKAFTEVLGEHHKSKPLQRCWVNTTSQSLYRDVG